MKFKYSIYNRLKKTVLVSTYSWETATETLKKLRGNKSNSKIVEFILLKEKVV